MTNRRWRPSVLPGCARALALAVTVAGLSPSALRAQPPAEEVARRSLEAFYYAGNDMTVRVSMSLMNPEGRKRERVLTMLRKNQTAGGEQRYFMFFHEPADVKGMSFLVWKYPGKEDDRWLFIPALKLVRRVAASDKRSSFVGSDFTYEDVSGRDLQDENHTLLPPENVGERPCHVLESIPRGNVDYARRVSWVDQERWLPLRERYFNAKGELIREFTADDVQEVSGRWTAVKRTMKNIQSGHSTEVVFDQPKYDVGLEEEIFSERYLRQPPRQWIP
jgi:hypothetical protein